MRIMTTDFDANAPGYSADVDGQGNAGWMLWESELGYHPGSLFNTHQLHLEGNGNSVWTVEVAPVNSDVLRSVPGVGAQSQTSIALVSGVMIRALRVVMTTAPTTPILKLASWTTGI